MERRKFSSLGLTIPYDFNDSDFQVSENILKLYLDEMQDNNATHVPWDTIKYLVAEASYGGRVTDDWDRRVLKVYADQYFCIEAITVPQFKLSKHEAYFVPSLDGTLNVFKEYISSLQQGSDPPEAFGQHSNADIASQIEQSTMLLETLIIINANLLRSSVDREAGAEASHSVEDRVFTLAQDLEERIPELLDLEAIQESKAEETGALVTVLFQEIVRYNKMLGLVRDSLHLLKRAIRGMIVMNEDLEEVFQKLTDGKVPSQWLRAYPSLKPLASWSRDLIARVEQLSNWGMGSQPKVFWLSGFTYPTGFLKALQQQAARNARISIDKFGWEFIVLPSEDRTITQSPKEGAYIRGIFLEGAGWDNERACLCEPNPMELITGMPLIHFKPVELKKKTHKGIFTSPLYMYPTRTGTRERPSFVIGVDLNAGVTEFHTPEHWVKRGTALLLSTDT